VIGPPGKLENKKGLETCCSGPLRFCCGSAAGFHIHRPDELVAAPHHARHALIALAFPALHRVGFIPGFVELAVLFRQAQVVLLAHVEIGARDHAADGGAGHDFLGFEIDLSQA
jgi:hypothetical protein